MRKDGYYLLVDMDDFLINSAPLLQAQVNDKTNFKTDTLEMLEQLNRNCKYYYNVILEECKKAREENRIPELRKFLNFDELMNKYKNTSKVLEEYDKFLLYEKPYIDAKNYFLAANAILNQFLEERDTFLETDNLPYGEIRKFKYSKEMEVIENFVDLISQNKNILDKINKFCYNEIKKIIRDAKKQNKNGNLVIPNYGELIKMDNNDIIKTTSLSINSSKERILYKKPIDDIEKCMLNINRINDIIKNAGFIIQPSRELVDYENIYVTKNVNMDAVRLVKRIMDSGLVAYGTIATHHTGLREDKCKQVLKNKILPKLGYVGMRFHSEEHDVTKKVRRGRSSKIDIVCEKLGIRHEQVILLDDSMANCADCNQKGGFAILYKPYTDAEIIKDELEDVGMVRITEFNQEDVLEIINNHIMNKGKQKKIGGFYE